MLKPPALPGQAIVARGSKPDPEAALLHEKLLRLVCGLCVAMGLFYGAYFLLAGMGGRSLVALCFVAIGAAAAFHARRTGRHHAALDGLSAALFITIACVALFEDGVNSPALRWLIAPLCVVLLAGSSSLAAVLFGLFLLEVLLLAWHGPGSWAPVSLLVPATYQQMTTAVVMSTLCVGTIVGSSARWTFGLQRALQVAHKAAVAAVAAQARFVSHLSHELRTPLQGLVGATDILKANHLSGTQREHIVAIQGQSVKSVLELLNAVLDFAKLEAGKIKLNTGPLDLRALVLEINEQFAMVAFKKGLELTSSCARELPASATGDSMRLRQVIGNLVSNAVKFTHDGGVHIHVSAAEAAHDAADESIRRIRIEVTDTGLGMDARCLESLFKPFHQADETVAPRFGGTGLGLSISRSLVALMGGRIEVASVPGVGSTFTVVVPLRSDAAPMPPNAVSHRAGIALVATPSPGLWRHLGCCLEELGVEAVWIEQLPDEEDIGRTQARYVFVDSSLLRSDPVPPPAGPLGKLPTEGCHVVIVAPLTDAPEPAGLAGVSLLYKPVSKPALLALLDRPATTASLAERPHPSPGAPASTSGRPLVLISEDDRVNQIVVASMLATCGIDVVTASDGQEALDLLKRQRVALVLTDIRMPGLDGLASTRALRQWERAMGLARTPVVAMTGHYETEETDACLEAGIDDVLVKPFRLEDLRRKLQVHLPK